MAQDEHKAECGVQGLNMIVGVIAREKKQVVLLSCTCVYVKGCSQVEGWFEKYDQSDSQRRMARDRCL